MPVAQPGAPKCPPFASLCECNKNHYYFLETEKVQNNTTRKVVRKSQTLFASRPL